MANPVSTAEIKRLLLKGSAGSFAAKIAGAGVAFAVQIVLARSLGVEAFGVYTYVTTWVAIASLIAPLGTDRSILRFVPMYVAKGMHEAEKRFVSWAASWTLAISAALAAAFAVGAVLYREIEPDSQLAIPFLVASLLLPTNALAKLGMETIRAYGRVVMSETVNMILRPAFFLLILLIVGSATGGMTVEQAITLNTATGVIALFAMLKLVRSCSAPTRKDDERHISSETSLPHEWLPSSLPLLMVVAGNITIGRIDLVLLGIFEGTTSAGLYNAAARVATLIGFPLMAVNAILAPVMSRLFHEQRMNLLQRTITKATALATVVTAIVAVGVWAEAEWILSLYGEEFRGQALVLSILLLGQVASCFAGSVGYLLSVSGHQSELARIIAASAIVNVALNMILIRAFGGIGAAIATAMSVLVSNGLMAFTAYRRLGINTTIFSIGRAA